jgi:hypothetical protein
MGEDKKKLSQEQEVSLDATNRNYPFRPLVYILTSDFYEAKCEKIFNFPVLTPSIRSKDLPSIKEILKMFTVEALDSLEIHQKILAWWLLK